MAIFEYVAARSVRADHPSFFGPSPSSWLIWTTETLLIIRVLFFTMVGKNGHLPANRVLGLRMLMMILRRKFAFFFADHFPTATEAAVNA